MSLTTCPDCGQSISDQAPTCIHCGRPRNLTFLPETSAPPSQSIPRVSAVLTRFPLFPVATHKFIVLSIFSLTVYTFYWFYQNWKRLKSGSHEHLSPFWRTAFAPLWGFSLFNRIHAMASEHGIATDWSPTALGILFFALNMVWALPDPWWWISFAALVPMIPVQQAAQRVNDIYAHSVGEPQNNNYSRANVTTIVIGGLILVLAIIGSFTPDSEPLPTFTVDPMVR